MKDSDPDAAQQAMTTALAIARQQGARSFELLAALSLTKLAREPTKQRAAIDDLRRVFTSFTEGFETGDLIEAKAVLARRTWCKGRATPEGRRKIEPKLNLRVLLFVPGAPFSEIARVQRLDIPAATLGEGAIWSDRDSCFYFVDIIGHRVCRYRPADGAYRHWQFGGFVGSLAECRTGGLIIALGDSVVHFVPEAGVDGARALAALECDRPRNRLNDGKPDPWGHFWVGSMQVDEGAPTGRLWRVSADGEARSVRDGIYISNGLAFDEQRGRIYFTDSKLGVIECAELDQDHLPKRWRFFARAEAGVPDGSAVDAAGGLWNAEWDGRRLTRYTPDGTIDRVVEIPTKRPTCPAFGGPDRRSLFVTSANHNLSADELLSDRHAGAAFLLQLDDVQGLPPSLFAL